MVVYLPAVHDLHYHHDYQWLQCAFMLLTASVKYTPVTMHISMFWRTEKKSLFCFLSFHATGHMKQTLCCPSPLPCIQGCPCMHQVYNHRVLMQSFTLSVHQCTWPLCTEVPFCCLRYTVPFLFSLETVTGETNTCHDLRTTVPPCVSMYWIALSETRT